MATVFRRLADLLRRPLSANREGEGWVVSGVRLTTRVGDIAAAEADGIVSSANSGFVMDVGVSKALRLAGGESIAEEARGW